MMEKTDSDSSIHKYAAVTNIPSNFRTADLRAHFSALVERGSFVCFHFRHRPEKAGEETLPSTTASGSDKTTKVLQQQAVSSSGKKCCCVVKVCEENMAMLLKYNDTNWTDKGDGFYGDICKVSLINVAGNSRTRDDESEESKSDTISEETLLQMAELRPPELMPQGNVGTPTLIFLNLVQRCLLPQTLIKKLDLKFPKTRSKRLYDSVGYDYETNQKGLPKEVTNDRWRSHPWKPRKLCEQSGKQTGTLGRSKSDMATSEIERGEGQIAQRSELAEDNQEMSTSPKRNQCPASTSTSTVSLSPSSSSQGSKEVVDKSCNVSNSQLTNRQKKAVKKAERQKTHQLMAEGIEEKMIAVEKAEERATEEAGEEWDRHEASEDDPSNQERNKERLYEEEIEQPWEKGGPGVVFYTDAMFWQEKEGDFDEQTTDDLDVDFSPYEDGGPGDMDIRDFLKVRQEQRFRSGYDKTDRFSIGIAQRVPSTSQDTRKVKIGQFEKHSKGFGRKLMERQGWTDGRGLGRSEQGMAQALRGEGQKPHNKRGIGFVQEEPVQFRPGPKKAKPHLITTVFDPPDVTDPKELLLQRSEPTTLKHRPEHVQSFRLKNNKKS